MPARGSSTRGDGPPPPTPPGTGNDQGGRPSGRLAVVVLVLLVLVISYASSLRAWLEQRDEIAAARTELAETRDRVAGLETDKQRWQDPAYVKSQARARLGFVLPGEVGYTVVDADGQPVGSDVNLDEPVAEPAGAAATDWYSSVWGSVRAAGVRGNRQ